MTGGGVGAGGGYFSLHSLVLRCRRGGVACVAVGAGTGRRFDGMIFVPTAVL